MKTNAKLTLATIVERDPDVFAAVSGKDVVMVSIASGSYYGVTDVSRMIWEAIERPIRISEMVASLSAAFDVDRVTCEEETLSFLEDLRSEGLLRIADEPPE